MSIKGSEAKLVTITVDDNEIQVPEGMNLIEAVSKSKIEIPHYCYHPHLSVAGNCRMCQIEIEGRPKLEIACNMTAQEGLKIRTHATSEAVKNAQASTLEFILINHPLDCTVCDQAGHCKLQDYHFQYNARPSRFVENKVNKAKAKPLGPTVVLDGERCIMCTRCIRFCDEVTETSELGMVNRGDKSEITVNEGRKLDNPLSGCVVDLCPVGALTHRNWRFNTRIWFTKAVDSVCPGCSTGCNARVYSRDKNVVQVKSRRNDEVNKDWLCDEGRYGFDRFLPEERVIEPRVGSESSSWEEALTGATSLKGKKCVVFLSPDLHVEEYEVLKRFVEQVAPESHIAVSYRERSLSKLEAILMSPDSAPNIFGAEFAKLISDAPGDAYESALRGLNDGAYDAALLVGDRAILTEDLNDAVLGKLSHLENSVGIFCDSNTDLQRACKVVLPGRSVLEKAGMFINRGRRLQYCERAVEFPQGSKQAWRILNELSEKLGKKITTATDDRALTNWYLEEEGRLAGLSIRKVKAGGVDLTQYQPATTNETETGVQPRS